MALVALGRATPPNKRPPRAACWEDEGVLGRGASRAPQRPLGLKSLWV